MISLLLTFSELRCGCYQKLKYFCNFCPTLAKIGIRHNILLKAHNVELHGNPFSILEHMHDKLPDRVNTSYSRRYIT